MTSFVVMERTLKRSTIPNVYVASVCGHVERVNKLVSVIPTPPIVPRACGKRLWDESWRSGHTLESSDWRLVSDRSLPLSGVHLPGGVQRVRTQEDSREMDCCQERRPSHCRSSQHASRWNTHATYKIIEAYGKVENGCLVSVPPSLIARRKNHFCDIDDITLLLGMNGSFWIQRSFPKSEDAQLAERRRR
jgi:exosome complex component RRP4